jgi:hypothetical protein
LHTASEFRPRIENALAGARASDRSGRGYCIGGYGEIILLPEGGRRHRGFGRLICEVSMQTDRRLLKAVHRLKGCGLGLLPAALILLTSSTCLPGQAFTSDMGEFSGYVGPTFGGLGTHVNVGGSSGISFSKYAIALVDVSYMPLGHRTLRFFPGVTAATSNLYDFNFAIHIRVPVKHRWAPYGLVAPALMYNTYTITFLPVRGPVRLTGQSDTKFAFEVGGGLRYYVGEAWGIRSEYRYTASSTNFSRFVSGLFYEFSGTWPFLPRGHGRKQRQPL